MEDSEVLKAARSIVQAAVDDGTWGDLTQKIIRTRMAESLDVEPSLFATPHSKELIKQVIGELIPTSEDEEDQEPPPKKPKKVQPPKDVPKSSGAPKKPKHEAKRVVTSTSPSASPPPPQGTQKKEEETPNHHKSVQPDEPPAIADDNSESELSVLIDEEPKKRKGKGKGKEASKVKPKSDSKSKVSKGKEVLSKDEETIKKYKALVMACGVRKRWQKEFESLSTPREQISHLKKILSDLGMTGRMSLEQAKAIKEKRELKEELKDIIQFEKKRGSVRASRSKSMRRSDTSDEEADGEDTKENESSSRKRKRVSKVLSDDEDDEEDVDNIRRKPTAAKSIMAFLADQSDED